MSFEQDLRRLDVIATELERGDLSLEDALARFEEGIATLRRASEALTAAEGRVTRLVEEADGALAEHDVDG
ncbi:MAG: exodeoxyribonuclease VII small subunit [Gemmatimonadaceae bacterium]|nr:exodeoxyribonuclease VII small subunit [Gemmatimonadaceae bacterium]